MSLLADLVVVLHLAFIVFAAFGALLLFRGRFAALLHLPAVGWGAYIELSSGICPLTPLENHLRQAGGGAAYTGGFVENVIVPLVYPPALSSSIQVALTVALIALNVALYTFVLKRRSLRAGIEIGSQISRIFTPDL